MMLSGFKRIVYDVNDHRILIIIIVAFIVTADLIFGRMCPLVLFCGLPCPGCGLTRALYYLITGNIMKAFKMNASIFLWIPLIIWIFVDHYFLQRRSKKLSLILIMVCIITIAYYIYRLIDIYPDADPMIYYKTNLIYYLSHLKAALL